MREFARVMAVCSALFVLAGEAEVLAGGPSAAPEGRERIDVTVYGEDLGFIRDIRRVHISPGVGELVFQGIAVRVIPQSVQVRFPADSGVRVCEQRYEYDLLSPARLLEKYVGREVTLVSRDPQTGRDEEARARLLSVNGGTVFEIGGAVTIDPPGRIVFPSVPDDLRVRPTLLWEIEGPVKAIEASVEAAYLTGGLSWSADYVLTLEAGGGRATLAGWATVRNESGATYPGAALALVAGEVNRVRDGQVARDYLMKGAAMEMAAAAPDFSEEGLSEYHLYTLDRPVTLRDGATQRLALFDEAGLAVRTVYRIEGAVEMREWGPGEGARKEAAGVFVEFRNSGKEGLGIPLPRGTVRAYALDGAGGLRFLGEDRIGHTPRDGDVRLRLGGAFDISAERRQTGWAHPRPNAYESAEELTIRNHREAEVTVEVREGMAGEWRIVEASHAYEKADARTALFRVAVPGGGKAVLAYRVRAEF
jgi:hypothetical protein